MVDRTVRLGQAPPASPWSAYLELVRLPNLFTAMADVTMGYLFVRAYQPEDRGLIGVLVAASALLYAGGVVLNDLFDLRLDLSERPERPLPSRRVSVAAARRLAGGLLGTGLAAAWIAAWLSGGLRPGAVGCLLFGLIILYDGWLKHTPLGPIAMGGCRALNVLLGMGAATEAWGGAHFTVAAAIGTYITGVTWLARSETRRTPRLHILGAILVMLGGVAILGLLPRYAADLPPLQEMITISEGRWQMLLLFLGILIGWRSVRAMLDPHPQVIQIAVSQAILSVVILDAVACFAARDMVGAIPILLFLAPTILFGQFFRST